MIYAVLIWVNYNRSREAAIVQARTLLQSQTENQSSKIALALSRASRVADSLAADIGAKPPVNRFAYRSKLFHYMLREKHSHMASIAIIAEKVPGVKEDFAAYFERKPPRPGTRRRGSFDYGFQTDYKNKQWYKLALKTKKGVWSQPTLAKNGRMICIYSAPIFRIKEKPAGKNNVPTNVTEAATEEAVSAKSSPQEEEREIIGVAAVDFDLSWLDLFITNDQLGKEESVIIDKSGYLINFPGIKNPTRAHMTIFEQAEKMNCQDLAALGEKMAAGDSGAQRVHIKGMPSLAIFTPIKSANWSYAAILPESLILDPVDQYISAQVAILLIALMVVVAVVVGVSMTMTRPIHKLSAAVNQLSAGNFRAKIAGTESKDEIGDVAKGFNLMVDNLNDYMNKLEQEVATREAVESDIRVARSIQTSMLPDKFPAFPSRSEFDLYAVNYAAKEVAGDFYDFFLTDDPNKLGFVIADVSGKGIPAALFMAISRTVVRNLAKSGDLSPAQILTSANRLLMEENKRNMFVTLFFAYYHTQTGKLEYANAGHNPPYLISEKGTLRKVEPSTGPMLGVFDEIPFTCASTTIDPGQTLLLYTDGIIEATCPTGEMYTAERLEEKLTEVASYDPSVITERIISDVAEFEQGQKTDDITLLLLRRKK